jgi:hypothetical protein
VKLHGTLARLLVRMLAEIHLLYSQAAGFHLAQFSYQPILLSLLRGACL